MTDLEMYKKLEKIRQDLNDFYFEIQKNALSIDNDKLKLMWLDKAEDYILLVSDEFWNKNLTLEQRIEIINETR